MGSSFIHLIRKWHFNILFLKVLSVSLFFSCVQLFVTLWTVAHQASLSMDSPDKNWSDCHLLLQEIFRTQGLNPDLPHCRQILYHRVTKKAPT